MGREYFLGECIGCKPFRTRDNEKKIEVEKDALMEKINLVLATYRT